MSYNQIFEIDLAGDTFCGLISSFNDKEFFVVESESVGSIIVPESLNKIWWYISYFEPFFLQTDDGLFRAFRVPMNNDADNTLFMQIFLVDTGEQIVLKIADFHFHSTYEIPEAIKAIPALAIKCIWNEINIDNYENDLEFFESNLYCKFTIEVVSVKDDFLVVNIHPFEEHQEDDESSEEASEEETEIEGKETSEDNPPCITMESFGPVEKSIWKSDPLSTSDSLKAVQGFSSQDDYRRCKFYDPVIGGCWKGGGCTGRHTTKIDDGTFRDKIPVYYNDIPNTLPLPPIGSVHSIEITTVVSANVFWCRYLTPRGRDDNPLNCLMALLNNPKETATYKPLKMLPAELELVIVKGRDGRYYRGRVYTLEEDEITASVLLVDYGVYEKANIQDSIFIWAPRFALDLPFQAVQMEIANISATHDKGGVVIGILKKLINKENKFKALICENVIGIKCRLQHGVRDFGEMLVEAGLAQKREVLPSLEDLKYIPG